eukprot:CAMPEP_0178407588 /NCGR_PEP_ID=MMETSP0689_2-20121128/19505_1 /TAXON_ID=160604 /ORGANISM="Amphidinium massartii, Strain CS-259" /LENGTH=447 /DNA_ID=CAMNT_0020028665 /DNA_START=150 /DNA_END=1490 /DNA_ORIENTATION=-
MQRSRDSTVKAVLQLPKPSIEKLLKEHGVSSDGSKRDLATRAVEELAEDAVNEAIENYWDERMSRLLPEGSELSLLEQELDARGILYPESTRLDVLEGIHREAVQEHIRGRQRNLRCKDWVIIQSAHTLYTGQEVTGTIRHVIADVGVFVDIGVERLGLVRWPLTLDSASNLVEGAEVNVWVYRVAGDQRISLSFRRIRTGFHGRIGDPLADLDVVTLQGVALRATVLDELEDPSGIRSYLVSIQLPWGGRTVEEMGDFACLGKEYQESLVDLCNSTKFQFTDLDEKAVAVLDLLQDEGKAADAIAYLKELLSGVERKKIRHWRSYVNALLRSYDDEAYQAMLQRYSARSAQVFGFLPCKQAASAEVGQELNLQVVDVDMISGFVRLKIATAAATGEKSQRRRLRVAIKGKRSPASWSPSSGKGEEAVTAASAPSRGTAARKVPASA